MPDLIKIYLFRMTHIGDIPHILQYAITYLVSANKNKNNDIKFLFIWYYSIQMRIQRCPKKRYSYSGPKIH